MKELIIIIFILLFKTYCFSQHLVSGQILNKERNGIENATVRIFSNDTIFIKGCVTDSLGFYHFYMTNGNYLIYVNSLGFKDTINPISIYPLQKNILPIILDKRDFNISEITINAQSYIRKDNKVVIIPNKQQIKHATTGYDLLYNLMIPSINIDRNTGSVKTFGGEVSLYIDGRKTDYREIQNLRSIDIEKVEYIDVPSGKYMNEIAVINYITKKYTSGGYISFDMNQTIGYLKGDYNIAGKYSHNNIDYTLLGGYQRNKYNGDFHKNHEIIQFSPTTINRYNQTIEALNKSNQEYIQLHISKSSKKSSFTGKLSFIKNNIPSIYQNNTLAYKSINNEYKKESKSQRDQLSLMPSIYLYGNLKPKKNQYIEITLNTTYTNTKYNRNYKENDYNSYSHVTEEFYNFDLKANYNINLKNKNSFGIKLTHVDMISNSQYVGDNNTKQYLWSGESLIFTEYMQRIGNKISYQIQPGISILQYKLHNYNLINRISPRLELSVTYRPNLSQQLQIRGGIANTYPVINKFNDIEQIVDSLQITRGNPNLDKTSIYRGNFLYALKFKILNIQAGAFYSYANNAILDHFFIEKNKLVHSFSSNAFYHGIESLLSLSCKIKDSFNFKIDNYILNTKIGGINSQSRTAWVSRVDINLYWKYLLFNSYIRSPEKLLRSNGIRENRPFSYGLITRWNYKALTIELDINKLFINNSERQYSFDSNVYSYLYKEWNEQDLQSFIIKLAYTFDFGKKTSKTSRNINTYINSAILKTE